MDYISFCLAYIIDRISKKWANTELDDGEVKQSPVKGVYFMRITNKGFAHNVLSEKPTVVKAGSVLAFVMAVAYAITGLNDAPRLARRGYSFMLGGGFSNLRDRLVDGGVTDFIYFERHKKIVYNFADFFIFMGAAAVIISELSRILRRPNSAKRYGFFSFLR